MRTDESGGEEERLVLVLLKQSNGFGGGLVAGAGFDPAPSDTDPTAAAAVVGHATAWHVPLGMTC